MLAKIIAHAPDRPRAIARMRRALGETVIEGIGSNVAMHRWILKQGPFVSGRYDTHFLEDHLNGDEIRAEAEQPN
jgi:acetyl-CoA carboxylase biotin carboxylase subunit